MMNRSSFSKEFLLKSATIFAIVVAIVLILGKGFAYFRSRSLSIEASLLDSCLDGLVSLVNFFAVRHALRPADEDHGYGHGKAEALAGLIQSIFIAASSCWLLKEVISRLLYPEPLIFDEISFYVLCFASVLTLMLVIWQRYVISHTASIAISADCLHYQTDLYANIGVMLSVFTTQYFNLPMIDTLAAALICFYILKVAFEIGKRSFDILMDRELSDRDVSVIRKIIQETKGIKKFSNLKTRSCGHCIFIQADAQVNGALSVSDTRMITESVRQTMSKYFDKVEIVIQYEQVSE